MVSKPVVSIITPSYNQGRFIEDTIVSVQKQDYPYIDHIIIDGGSTDNTLEILQKYDDKIIWISEKDKGQADAVNKGLKIARGEIIGWLNSDDFYVDRKVISTIVELFQTEKSADVIYGNALWIDEDNKVFKVNLKPSFATERLRRFDFIPQPATFFRSKSASTPLLRTDLYCAMDYDLWLRMAKTGYKFKFINRFLAAMRYHKLAKSVRVRAKMWSESDIIRKNANIRFSFDYYIKAVLDSLLLFILKLRGVKVFYSLDKYGLGKHRIEWTVDISMPLKSERWLYQLNLKGGGSPILTLRYLFRKPL